VKITFLEWWEYSIPKSTNKIEISPQGKSKEVHEKIDLHVSYKDEGFLIQPCERMTAKFLNLNSIGHFGVQNSFSVTTIWGEFPNRQIFESRSNMSRIFRDESIESMQIHAQ